MSKTQYELTEQLIINELGDSVKIYGIRINSKTVIDDVSCNKKTVLDLIDRLNGEELDIKQLIYIIEDSII